MFDLSRKPRALSSYCLLAIKFQIPHIALVAFSCSWCNQTCFQQRPCKRILQVTTSKLWQSEIERRMLPHSKSSNFSLKSQRLRQIGWAARFDWKQNKIVKKVALGWGNHTFWYIQLCPPRMVKGSLCHWTGDKSQLPISQVASQQLEYSVAEVDLRRARRCA